METFAVLLQEEEVKFKVFRESKVLSVNQEFFLSAKEEERV